MIEGVMLKALKTYPDERGYFREIIRTTDAFFAEGFAQLSQSLMYPGTAKAWHIHPTQVDWWYVPIGNLKVGLYDKRERSATFGQLEIVFLGEHHAAQVLKIPAGVAHGCRCYGPGATHLFYITSNIYDPKEEGRIPHDDPEIGYDWTAGPEIK